MKLLKHNLDKNIWGMSDMPHPKPMTDEPPSIDEEQDFDEINADTGMPAGGE